MDTKRSVISELNDRSREIFMKIDESYVETGDPIGSRLLSEQLSTNLSPATVRNVMADLENCGLLFSPHIFFLIINCKTHKSLDIFVF